MALCRAVELIKADGSIYLYSDLYASCGQPEEIADVLRGNNIRLHYIKPAMPISDEVVMVRARSGGEILAGQPVNIYADIESSQETDATLNAYTVNGELLAQTEISLVRGMNTHVLPVIAGSEAYFNCSVEVVTENDSDYGNNTALISQLVAAKRTLHLLVKPQALSQNIASLLRDSSLAVSEYGPGDELHDADVLILNSLPEENTLAIAGQIRRGVSAGMGLLVLPGVNSLISDHLSDLLPLYPVRDSQSVNPDTAVVFVVDTSASMAGQLLALAKEVIKLAAMQLGQSDLVGIVEFYGNKRWTVPLQSANNYLYINRSLSRLNAEGGSVVLPALEEAYYALMNVKATTKHIILITDGDVQKADFTSLARKAAADKIAFSTVLIGPSTQVAFLADIARKGNGEFFHVRDNLVLPAIDFKEIFRRTGSSLRFDTEALTYLAPYAIFDGVDVAAISGDMTWLAGELKTGAQSLLYARQDRPLLASWYYDMGEVAQFSGDVFAHDLDNEQTATLLRNLCLKLAGDKPLLPARDGGIKIESDSRSFEVAGCYYDDYLAYRLEKGNVVEERHIQEPVDLWPVFVVISLLLFLGNIILRRISVRVRPVRSGVLGAILLLLVISGSELIAQEFNNVGPLTSSEKEGDILRNFITASNVVSIEKDSYFGYMLDGFDLYLRKDTELAFTAFSHAWQLSEDADDRKYALAWSLLAGDKCGKVNALVDTVLLEPDAARQCARQIMFYLGYKKNVPGMLRLEKLLKQMSDTSDEKQMLMLKLSDLLAQCDVSCTMSDETEPGLTFVLAAIKREWQNSRYEQANSLISEYIEVNDDPDSLVLLAETINTYGCYDQAESALVKAISLKGQKNSFDAILLLSELKRKQGDIAGSLTLLDDIASWPDPDQEQLYRIAFRYIELSEYDRAQKLLLQLYQDSNAYDLLCDLAYNSEMAGELEQSYHYYLQAWQQTQSSSARYILEPQLLEMAARAGELLTLVQLLEYQIAENIQRDKSIELLSAIYINSGDPLAMVELVKQYYDSDTIASQVKQIHLYQNAGLYGNCISILKQLIIRDKQNNREYLRWLALLAVQNEDMAAAYQALSELEALPDISNADRRYIADIFVMLGNNEKALPYYRQILDVEEFDDSWYRWSQAALMAGHKHEVLDHLETMLDGPLTDSRLCIVTDILLAADAGPELLERTLAVATDRLVEFPEQSVFYELAIDIMTRLGYSSDSIVRARLAASLYFEPRRFSLLREIANLDHWPESNIDIEVLLLSLDCHISGSYISHTARLLMNSDNKELADYYYKNVFLPHATIDNVIEIVNLYDQRGMLEQAAALLKEAVLLYQDNMELYIRLAGYYEIEGDFNTAYKCYEQVYDRLASDTYYDLISADKDKVNSDRELILRKVALEGMIVTCADISGQLQKHILMLIEACDRQQVSEAQRQVLLSLRLDYDLVLQAHKNTIVQDAQVSFMPEPASSSDNSDNGQGVADKLNELKDNTQRADILHEMISKMPMNDRAGLILELLSELNYELSGDEQEYLCDIIDTSPAIELARKWSYRKLLDKASRALLNEKPLIKLFTKVVSCQPDNIIAQALDIILQRHSKPDSSVSQRVVNLIELICTKDKVENVYPDIIQDILRFMSEEELNELLEKYSTGFNAPAYVFVAAGYEFLGDKQRAMSIARECFIKYPQDRIAFQYISDLFQRNGRVVDLIEPLKQFLAKEPGHSFYWRTVFGFAVQAGDYETALEAAGYDTTAMNTYNYLYLASIADDKEMLCRYFRKYMVDCRRQRQFVSFKWQSKQEPGGLVGFLDNCRPTLSMFQKLAENEILAEEFIRYSRTVNSNMRYFKEYASAMAIIEGHSVSSSNELPAYTYDAGSSYQAFTAREYFDLMQAELARGDVEKALECWPGIIEDKKLNPREMEVVDLMAIRDSSCTDLVIRDFVVRSVTYLSSALNYAGARKGAIVKYLAMLAVMEVESGGPSAELLATLRQESAHDHDLTLWYLDVLTYGGFEQEATELAGQLSKAGTLPFCRQK
ncbi:MAG: VWA domain-containing protein [Sedimentisphaerales bacterium]|nr:VWA domain-containing protein [Sedimentisphaerales bacterium]